MELQSTPQALVFSVFVTVSPLGQGKNGGTPKSTGLPASFLAKLP